MNSGFQYSILDRVLNFTEIECGFLHVSSKFEHRNDKVYDFDRYSFADSFAIWGLVKSWLHNKRTGPDKISIYCFNKIEDLL